MLQEIIDKMVAFLTANNGQTSWSALRDHLEYQERGAMMDAVRLAESQGVLRRNMAYSAETGTVFTVDLIGGE